MKKKLINFKAVHISCSEALDWEIVQVCFDSEYDSPQRGELDFDWDFPMVTFSVNFEFSGTPSVEWNDGDDFGGGRIKNLKLTRDVAFLETYEDIKFNIHYDLNDEKYRETVKFLKIIFAQSKVLDINEDQIRTMQ